MAKSAEAPKWWTLAHGEKLRQARLEKGLTQKQAAAELDVRDDTVRNWENAETQPRDGNLAAVAAFCGCTIDDLRALTRNTASQGKRRWMPLIYALTIAAVIAAAIVTIRGERRAFAHIRALPNGIEAVSESGATLWRATGIDPVVAQRWALAQVNRNGSPLVAAVLVKRHDFSLDSVRNLSFIVPEASELRVVDRVRLSEVADVFPTYARRYEVSSIVAVDIDSDGLDEVIVTYQQVPECVSWTVLYEPLLKRQRVVFAQTGAHHFAGAYDLDFDGRRDLLFLGINNGYNWVNALAAIRVEPWIGTRSHGDDATQFSPDSAIYVPNDRVLLFYALLPRGRVPDDPGAVTWDPRRRTISVQLLSAPPVQLTAGGFLLNEHSPLPERELEAARREATRRNRESRRLRAAGSFDAALLEARLAVAAAERSSDTRLVEVMRRDLGKTLITAGAEEDGRLLLQGVAASSENASEIYYDAALAFHLRGNLSRAVEFYERGVGAGGSPEAGKSKHEFIQAEVFALAERKAWREALDAVERFRARFVNADDSFAMYREFIRWRTGEVPRVESVAVYPNATDLTRYWVLEFRNARGDDASTLLRVVDALRAEQNRPLGAILSLRAQLLSRLGRHDEAAMVIKEARATGHVEAKSNIIARGHLAVIEERYGQLYRHRRPFRESADASARD